MSTACGGSAAGKPVLAMSDWQVIEVMGVALGVVCAYVHASAPDYSRLAHG